MDKHAVKVVKGDETVSQLPCKFSQIAWLKRPVAEDAEGIRV